MSSDEYSGDAERARIRYEEKEERLRQARERYPGGPEEAWAKMGYDIPRINAQLFEGVPERFSFADVQYAGEHTDLSEEDLREVVKDWQRREMVTSRNGLFVKTGHRPYRTDMGTYSEGNAGGSNLD